MTQKFEESTGIIVDANDPEKLGRVKVVVPSLFDLRYTPLETIPWVYPKSTSRKGTFSQPRKGQKVKVYNNVDNYSEFWYEQLCDYDEDTQNLIESQDNVEVLLNRTNGSSQDQIYSTETEGIVISHDPSKIQLQPNGNVIIEGGNGNTTMSINNDVVTIGNKQEDMQYGVLSDELEALLQTISNGLANIAERAVTIPYVQGIASDLITLSNQINNAIPQIKAKNIKYN